MNFLKILLVSLVFLMTHQAYGAAKKEPEAPAFTKKELKKHITNIEKELNNIKNALKTLTPEKKKKKTGTFISFSEKFFSRVMIYFIEREESLKEDFLALENLKLLFFYMGSLNFWILGGVFLLKFLGATLCAAGAYFLAFKGVQSSLKRFLKWGKRQDLSIFVQISLGGVFFVLPLLAFSLTQITVFFLSEKSSMFRSMAISLTTGGLFLWFIWGITYLIINQRPPFPPLFRLNSQNALRFSFWLKGVGIFHVFGGFAADIAELAGVAESGQKALVNLFNLGLVICALFLIQVLRRPVMVALTKKSLPLLLQILSPVWSTFASASIIIMYGLLIFDEMIFDLVFSPFLMTLCGLFLGCNIYLELRRLRLSYLWRWRHSNIQPPLYKLLKPHTYFNLVLKWIIYGTVVFLIFEIWGFDFLFLAQEIFKIKAAQQMLDIFLVLFLAYVLVCSGDRVLNYYLGRIQTTDSIEADYLAARFRTLLKIARTLLRVGIWIPITLIILSTLNYDTTPILASVGIITAGLTFGAQSIVKDFLSGFLLILENSLVVGDQVEIDGKSGTVEDLTLRILRVRMDNGTLLTVPFGNISVIGNRSRYFAYAILNISVGYKEDPDAIQRLLEKAYQTLRKTPLYSKKILAPIEFRGITDVTDFSMIFQARLKTAPGQQDFIKRAFNRALKQIFDEAGIQVPSPPYYVPEKHMPSLTNTP